MFLPDKSKQYQHLTQFLRQAARRRPASVMGPPPFVFGAALLLAIGVGIMATNSLLLMLVPALAIVGLFAWTRSTQRQHVPDARERLMLEAEPTVKTMLAHAESKRLHREMDEASLTLLEECARHYWRVNSVFNSPFWTGEMLPAGYVQVRESALRSAETTMDELMLLYRHSLPETPSAKPAVEYVEEALEQYVFKKPRPTESYIPPTFDPTRQIAEKLRILADEAERISRELVAEPSVPNVAVPGSALDASIGELRQIRQAEEELRQQLGG